MDISLSNAIIAEARQQGGLPAETLPADAGRVLKPLLGGTNVSVGATLVGDLDKLLAQVRAEQDEKRLQLAHQQLSAVLTQLSAMADLSVEQQQQVTMMQVKIEALEAAIKRETTTVEERKKALETKRQLEAQAQKDLADAEKAGDEAAVAEAKERLAGVQGEIAALDKEIAALEARIDSQNKDVDDIGRELSALLAKLDYPSLVVVLAAITVSASDTVQQDAGQNKEEDDGKLKIPSPLDVLRDSLEKAFKDLGEEIAEKRMETI